jgi:hypothetical protein
MDYDQSLLNRGATSNGKLLRADRKTVRRFNVSRPPNVAQVVLG